MGNYKCYHLASEFDSHELSNQFVGVVYVYAYAMKHVWQFREDFRQGKWNCKN